MTASQASPRCSGRWRSKNRAACLRGPRTCQAVAPPIFAMGFAGSRRCSTEFDDIAAQTGDAAILGQAQLWAEDCVRWLAQVGGTWRNGQS